MKQKFMKKALAVALSTAMVFSASSVAGMQSASAAAKFVGLNTTFKTLKVGQKDYKLRLVNNTQNWKIKKVATSNKKIAAVYGKKASYVLLKGKSEGRATIKVSLNTTARKKNNTKVLKCRVKVVGAGTTTPTPSPDPTPTTPSQTSKTVATQTELTAALADTTLKSITVKTDSKASLTIPAGAHTSVDLTVDAPNAEVTNSGVFKSITIAAIKDSTWTENAVGNNFKVDALKARIVVGTSASVTSVSVTKANADVAIIVNGKLAAVTISAKAKLALSGSATESVAVKIQAAGSELTADLPVAVEASADATITLQAKAEKSTVKITNTAATVTVKNNTSSTIAVTKADNKVQNVSPKGSATIKPSTSGTGTSTGSGSWGGGSSGSWGGGSNPSYVSKTANVYTQKQMDEALKNKALETINILSKKAEQTIEDDDKIIIPKGTYNVKLVVNAPQKTIDNSGKFSAIEINDIKSSTWIERSNLKNSFRVFAPNPHFEVALGAVIKDIVFGNGSKNASLEVKGTVESVDCNAEDANLKVDVQDAKAAVGTVSVQKSMTVTIVAVAEVAKDVKIKVELKAEKATLTSAVPVDVTSTVDDTVIVLEKTAEGSTITVTEDVKAVGVKTDVAVDVKKDNGEVVVELKEGAAVDVDVENKTTEDVKPTGVTLDLSEMEIDLATDATTGNLKLTPDPANASGNFDSVTWESSDPAVATVAGNGTTAVVTGVKGGTATITATATFGEETFTATCAVTVKDKAVDPEPAPVEGLTDATIAVATATVATKGSVGQASPAAIILNGVSATAKVDGSGTTFETVEIAPADGEAGIEVETGSEGIKCNVLDDTKTEFSIKATATNGSGVSFTATGTIKVTDAGNDSFTATVTFVADQTDSNS